MGNYEVTLQESANDTFVSVEDIYQFWVLFSGILYLIPTFLNKCVFLK